LYRIITALLKSWKDQARQYPILSTVARRVFAISASSAQSERDFSSVGRTVTDARYTAIGLQSRVNRNSAMGDPDWTGRAGIVFV